MSAVASPGGRERQHRTDPLEQRQDRLVAHGREVPVVDPDRHERVIDE
jgi:hypothetical protein